MVEATPTDEYRASLAEAREATASQEAEIQAVVERLQHDARAGHRVLTRMPGVELDRLIEQTVRALWAESRVTAFVPLLAMRRIDEELGLADPADKAAPSRDA